MGGVLGIHDPADLIEHPLHAFGLHGHTAEFGIAAALVAVLVATLMTWRRRRAGAE